MSRSTRSMAGSMPPGRPGLNRAGPASRGWAGGVRLPAPAALDPAGGARATPGRRLGWLRERAARLERVVLTPDALPRGERRMMAALLAVACGFVVLGGWVWSERRD